MQYDLVILHNQCCVAYSAKSSACGCGEICTPTVLATRINFGRTSSYQFISLGPPPKIAAAQPYSQSLSIAFRAGMTKVFVYLLESKRGKSWAYEHTLLEVTSA